MRKIYKKVAIGIVVAAAVVLIYANLYTKLNIAVNYIVWEIKSKIMEQTVGESPVERIPENQLTTPDLILLGARNEVINGTSYDASYAVIAYPNGDVSAEVGACTDVVIRALRNAGIDLQQLIHEDMLEDFAIYPQNWGLSDPDPNIDHRRIPNQMKYLDRYGVSLTTEVEGHIEEWQWGDIVYWRFPDGSLHAGIISDLTTRQGIPLVIHNSSVTREENCLERWEIIGHYRYR